MDSFVVGECRKIFDKIQPCGNSGFDADECGGFREFGVACFLAGQKNGYAQAISDRKKNWLI